MSFTSEIYSLSCFNNNDPDKGIACYRKYFNNAKNIIEKCPTGDNTCNKRAMDELNAGVGPCKCDLERERLWCNWIDIGKTTQAFGFSNPTKNVALAAHYKKKCPSYLKHYQHLFKDCRGCDAKSDAQFWCKNEPLIETWCKGRRNESSLIDMQNSVSDFLNRF